MYEVINVRYEILKYQNIRNLREDNDLSQKYMAKYLNVRQSTYSRYETDDINIPLDILIKLADYYNTSVDYLLGRTDEKKPYPKTKI